MAKIVFKQRHTDPKTHRKNNAGSNAQHLKYIATRPGVLIECAEILLILNISVLVRE